MATTRRSAGPALGEFLTALRSRLDALPPEGVAAALVAHAERLPVAGRRAFLDIFPEPHERPAVSGPPQPGEDLLAEVLLADIAAFAARAVAGEFAEDDDRYDDGPDDRVAAVACPAAG